MSGPLRVAMFLVSVALMAGAPAEAAKPKAKACKKGTVAVKLGKGTRCVKLRVAPPKPKVVDHGRLAFDRVLSTTWPALKDKRGRRVRSPLQELRHVPGGVDKVQAAVTKGLKLAAAKRTARAAQSDGGGLTGVAQGTTIGFDAVVPAGEYRIAISYRTDDVEGGSVKGVRCPTAAGLLKGDLEVMTRITIRITRDGELVSGTSTQITDTAHFEAQTADDAKLDTLDVDHVSALNHSSVGDGHAAIAIRMQAHRVAQVDMRSATNAYTLKSKQLDLRADVQGAPPDQDAALDAEAARKLLEGSDQSFSRIVARGVGVYRTIEGEINQAGTCATMLFDPPGEGARPTVKNGTGTFTSTMRPRVDPGNDAAGRWTLTDKRQVAIGPESASRTKPSFTFTVTDDGAPSGSATFRATSKAGVAVGTRTIPIEQAAPRYRVTAFTYTDQISFDGIAPYLGCAPSTSQGNATTLIPSGRPEDGALSPPIPAPFGNGEQTGLLTATGRIQKTVAESGCKWNDDATARIPCQLQNSGAEDFTLALDLLVPAGSGDAKLTWHVHRADVGDVAPIISACEIAVTQAAGPFTVVTSAPRAALLDPGPHTFSVDVPYEETGTSSYGGAIHSNAHYSITIERL
ncbi:hypothetical protein [Baekduia sp. Peel2402]|uniref:hypothetical protein n=1 Tax=Baekduia sp. Peel2402 TaxID=3458296 RepID=UPI00403EDDB6